jgi:hypothetical protein
MTLCVAGKPLARYLASAGRLISTGEGNLLGDEHIIVDEGLNRLVGDVVYNPC